MILGCNLIEYPGAVNTPITNLTTFKILANSIVSTKNKKYLILDIKDYYLNTEMERYKYTRLPINIIPKEIIQQYSLQDIVDDDGYVYI